jgi:hypothetical protein
MPRSSQRSLSVRSFYQFSVYHTTSLVISSAQLSLVLPRTAKPLNIAMSYAREDRVQFFAKQDNIHICSGTHPASYTM